MQTGRKVQIILISHSLSAKFVSKLKNTIITTNILPRKKINFGIYDLSENENSFR